MRTLALPRGVVPPFVTPLTADRELDVSAFEGIIENGISKGIHGVFVLGSCGEGSSVSRRQRVEVVTHAIRIVSSRLPLFVGVLETSTSRAVESMRELEQLGAENFVVTPAFYLENSCQDEILRHYESVLQGTDSAVVVYNIPQFTHVNIEPTTMIRLGESDRIVGFKESSPDWRNLQQMLLSERGPGYTILVGNEDYCASGLLFGADGCVPSMANAFPELFVSLQKAASNGETAKVMSAQRRISKLREVFRLGKSWISVMKFICSLKGLCGETVSLPIEPLAADEKNRIVDFVESLDEQ